MSYIKEMFYFETIKLVTIQNWKLGLLNRIIQLLVLVYIGVYAIWWNKGYQSTSPIDGVLFTKVKGVANTSEGSVVDAGDIVVPPTENNALFLTTRVLNTIQTENLECTDPDKANACTSNANCPAGQENPTSNGFMTGVCNNSRCVIRGWCPAEDNTLPFVEYQGIANWTIFMRTHVTYSNFNISTNNADQVKEGYNIFPVSFIVAHENWTSLYQLGGIINIKIDWSCNLDFDINLCKPNYSFVRVDNAGNASQGFNYRRAIYYNNNITAGTPPSQVFTTRVYTKLYGIRMIFHIDGTGRKFDVASTVVTIGSGIAFLGFATVATDFFLQYIHPKKALFDHAKRQPIVLEDEEAKLL